MNTSDQSPLNLGDRPKEHLTDDRFGYEHFARAIATSISRLSATDGVVLAVHGVWGSGKTTAINMIIEALSEQQNALPPEEKIIAARFNPWWFSEQQDLTKVFFSEVSAALGTKVSSEIRKRLKKIAKRLSRSNDLISAGLSFLPGGDAVKAVVTQAVEIAGDTLDAEKSLDQEREELSALLRSEGKRILIVIDDVDRLPTDEARKIFRLVKSVADLPNIIYLLVFDREIARSALSQDKNSDGPEWLEKIIQASFDLPPIHKLDLHRVLLDGLSAILGNVQISDMTRFGNVFHDAIAPWLKTPRDVKRLLNILSVSWPPIAQEVNFIDFVAIESLRLQEPKLYNFIRENESHLTGLKHDREAPDKEFGDKLLSCIGEPKQQLTKSALQRLFPRLESIWANRGYSGEFIQTWDRDRRICSPRRFPAYFTYAIGDNVLMRHELESIISKITDLESIRTQIISCTKIRRRAGGTKAAVLLDELTNNIDLIPVENLVLATQHLLDVADLFITPLDDQTGFSLMPGIWRVWFAASDFLRRLDIVDRCDVIQRAVQSSPSLRSISFVMVALAGEHGRDPDEAAKPEDQRLVTAVALDELQEEILKRFRAEAKKGSLLSYDQPLYLLHHWNELGKEGEVREWTAHILNGDDANVLRFAEVSIQKSQIFGMGDRVTREVPVVHHESLKKIVDIDLLYKKLQEIDARTAAPDAKKIILQFSEGLNKQRLNG